MRCRHNAFHSPLHRCRHFPPGPFLPITCGALHVMSDGRAQRLHRPLLPCPFPAGRPSSCRRCRCTACPLARLAPPRLSGRGGPRRLAGRCQLVRTAAVQAEALKRVVQGLHAWWDSERAHGERAGQRAINSSAPSSSRSVMMAFRGSWGRRRGGHAGGEGAASRERSRAFVSASLARRRSSAPAVNAACMQACKARKHVRHEAGAACGAHGQQQARLSPCAASLACSASSYAATAAGRSASCVQRRGPEESREEEKDLRGRRRTAT
jgi:hypothetical protein